MAERESDLKTLFLTVKSQPHISRAMEGFRQGHHMRFKGRAADGEGRERSLIHCFSVQVAITSGNRASQKPEVSSRSLTGVQGPKDLNLPLLLS